MDEKYEFMGDQAEELALMHKTAREIALMLSDENAPPDEMFDKGFNSALAVVKVLLSL